MRGAIIITILLNNMQKRRDGGGFKRLLFFFFSRGKCRDARPVNHHHPPVHHPLDAPLLLSIVDELQLS
jgi:hypothetical protein